MLLRWVADAAHGESVTWSDNWQHTNELTFQRYRYDVAECWISRHKKAKTDDRHSYQTLSFRQKCACVYARMCMHVCACVCCVCVCACVCVCVCVCACVCVCMCQTDRQVGSRLEGTWGPSQGFEGAPLLVTVVSGRSDIQVLYHSPRYPPNSRGPQSGWIAGLCARDMLAMEVNGWDSTQWETKTGGPPAAMHLCSHLNAVSCLMVEEELCWGCAN